MLNPGKWAPTREVSEDKERDGAARLPGWIPDVSESTDPQETPEKWLLGPTPTKASGSGTGHYNSGFYLASTMEMLCDLAESLALSEPQRSHMYNQLI